METLVEVENPSQNNQLSLETDAQFFAYQIKPAQKRGNRVFDLLDWIWETFESIDKERRGLFLCCLHSIWMGRNKLLFSGEDQPPEILLQKAF
ncbi:hypothetical protein PIB30_102265, partial [Stylosanthes scabra]|nr:hypothetical protein [Stylosanthes scabra]